MQAPSLGRRASGSQALLCRDDVIVSANDWPDRQGRNSQDRPGYACSPAVKARGLCNLKTGMEPAGGGIVGGGALGPALLSPDSVILSFPICACMNQAPTESGGRVVSGSIYQATCSTAVTPLFRHTTVCFVVHSMRVESETGLQSHAAAHADTAARLRRSSVRCAEKGQNHVSELLMRQCQKTPLPVEPDSVRFHNRSASGSCDHCAGAAAPAHSHMYVYALRRTHASPALQQGAVAQVESVPQMATPPHNVPAGATCLSSGHCAGAEGKLASGSDVLWDGVGTTLAAAGSWLAALLLCLCNLGAPKAT